LVKFVNVLLFKFYFSKIKLLLLGSVYKNISMKKIVGAVLVLLVIQFVSCIKDDVIDYDVMIEVKFFKDNQNISGQYKLDSIKVHTGCFIPTKAQPIKHADTSLIYGLKFCCQGDSAMVNVGKGDYLIVNNIDKFRIHMEYLDTMKNFPCEIVGANSIPNYSEVNYENKKITVSITEY